MTAHHEPASREVRLERLHPAELEAAMQEAPVAWVPLGALEFHAQHLPFGTDGFTAIQFTEDSVLGAITGKMDDSADLISDATIFPANSVIYLPATSVTLASGACIIYKA